MKCLDDCHTYEMDLFLNEPVNMPEAVEGGLAQRVKLLIHFYEMRLDGTKIDGVTNEEVIKVLIHRLKYLNYEWMDGKFDCPENREAIEALEYALRSLESRTRGREKRGVEGTHEA